MEFNSLTAIQKQDLNLPHRYHLGESFLRVIVSVYRTLKH